MIGDIVTKSTGAADVFPAVAIENLLRDALLDTVKSHAAITGTSLPPTKAAQYAAVISLDSLEVVDLLCGVEPLVGFELSDSVVKAGGYSSIDDAVVHLMPGIKAAWQKRKNKGGKK